MSKVVLIFLIFILVLGIFGKLRWPKLPKTKLGGKRSKKKVQATEKCPKCGRFNLDGKTCSCDG